MLAEINNINTRKKDIRSFGYTIGIILLFISLILFYYNIELYTGFSIVALVFIILGILFPLSLKPIYLIWMIFAVLLGWLMTRIILTLLFYIILTPIGLVTKLLGEDFLSLKNKRDNSYWNNRDIQDDLNKNYKKQF